MTSQNEIGRLFRRHPVAMTFVAFVVGPYVLAAIALFAIVYAIATVIDMAAHR